MASGSEDDEPSLGSFDRMTDQSKAWQQRSLFGRSMGSTTPPTLSRHWAASTTITVKSVGQQAAGETWKRT
jgi:hypothetical protein